MQKILSSLSQSWYNPDNGGLVPRMDQACSCIVLADVLAHLACKQHIAS